MTLPNIDRFEIVIVGAGIAGLIAARELVRHGREVVLLDKGRRPGGRLATRRADGFVFDHGAQYFTVRDDRFAREIERWRRAGAVSPWQAELVAFGDGGGEEAGRNQTRWVGMPGMNAVPAHLANGLDVRCSVTVGGIERDQAGWRILSAAGEPIAAAQVVAVTAPAPQAGALLPSVSVLARDIATVVMEPCWAVLLGFADPVPVDFDGAFVNAGPLSWVARNSSKPGRDGGEAWVLHAAPAWSEAHLGREADEVGELLTAEFAQRCVGGALPAIVHADAHRWRYAQPEPGLEAPCLFDEALGIGVAGDWCGGPRVEGAYLSGEALARRILVGTSGGATP